MPAPGWASKAAARLRKSVRRHRMLRVGLSEGLSQLRNEVGIEGQLVSRPGVKMIDALPGEVQVAYDHLQFLQRQWIVGRE